ncbi:hypothetical protein M422DRAFT_26225 [Sphaerobolus stellatus SS14]|nr:hypothetical protein M422DRAFT_26225 [Sphaerobolus stellatus SS14]
MDSGNVYQLGPPRDGPSNYNFNEGNGEEIEAEFLSFRLVSKKTRVKLSDLPLDFSNLPGKSRLLAVGNTAGFLAAATRKVDGYYLSIFFLSSFQNAMHSSSDSSSPITPSRPALKLPGTPNVLRLSANNEAIIVGFLEGPVLVYSSPELLNVSQSQIDPVYTITAPNTVPSDIIPNPGESGELVAILREAQNLEHQVDLVDIKQKRIVASWRQAGTEAVPTAISWSPKGKQIGIGLQSGDILLYSPSSPDSPKSHISRPPSIPVDNAAILSISWISNNTFHVIFSSPESCYANFDASASSSLNKINILYTVDTKGKTGNAVRLEDPSAPYGAQMAPGPLSVVLRDWDPARFMLVCGDGPSADIGVIASFADSWKKLSLEETSTPSLPMNEDMEDMPLLGLEVDLTSTKPVRQSDQPDDGSPELPPSPILYAYVSDGTIVAWNIVNILGGRYPGMAEGSISSSLPAQKPDMIETPGGSVTLISSPKPIETATSPFGQKSPSPFGQQTPSAFGQPAASALGQQTTTSAFGQQSATSIFGQQQTTTSAFGQQQQQQQSSSSYIAPAKGFGAFAGSSPSGFGASAQQTTSPFGQAQQTENKDSPSTSAIAPAFAGFGGKPNIPTFGATGFGSKPAHPTFGASGFGAAVAKPAFGQTGFGFAGGAPPIAAGSASTGGFASFASQATSGFGTATASGDAVKPASTGGFASFASQGTSSFGTSGTDAPAAGGFAAFANKGTSVFGQQSSTPAEAAKETTTTTSAFGAAPFKSAFGSGGSGLATTPTKSAFGAGRSGSAFATTTTTPEAPAPKPKPSIFGGGQPAFGQTGFNSSATSTTPKTPASNNGAFGGFGSFGDALNTTTLSSTGRPAGLEDETPPGSPTSDMGSPPDSPKLQSKLAIADTAKSKSSYIKPATGFGAFGGGSGFAAAMESKTSPSASSSFIKPAQGFGAFAQAKAAVIPPSLSGNKSSTASPMFGKPSPLGASSKPVFGTSGFGAAVPKPVVPQAEPSKPISGGFGAFSSGSGFASFSNPNTGKSFDEILKSSEPDKPKKTEPSLAFGGGSAQKVTVATATTPTSVNVPSAKEVKEEKGAKEGSLEIKKEESETSISGTSEGSSSRIKKEESETSISGTSEGSSFSLVSLSETLGPKDKQIKEEEYEGEETEKESEHDEKSEEFYLTDSAFDEGEDGEEERESDEEREERSVPPSPSRSEIEAAEEAAKVPLPASETPTPTSTPSTPKAADSSFFPPQPSTSPSPIPTKSAEVIAAIDDTTTPPGSPEKSPIVAPAPTLPKPTTPSPASFGFGLGRPSSRPIRSSPLASAPVTTAEETATDVTTTSKAPAAATEPTTPKTPTPKLAIPSLFTTSATPPQEPTISAPSLSGTPTPAATSPGATSPRPKTPPPLFGKHAAAASSAEPAKAPAPSLFGQKPATPAVPAPSLFGQKPAAAPPTPSFFGQKPTGSPTTPSLFGRQQQPPPSNVAPPAPSAFGAPSPMGPQIPFGGKSAATSPFTTPNAPVKATVPLPPPMHPLQAEFVRAYDEINEDVAKLKMQAGYLADLLPILSGNRGMEAVTRGEIDFKPGTYSLGESKTFRILLDRLRKDVASLLEQGKAEKRLLQNLQNLALISETKKEELARWVRAREDPDFAKTLKPRSLGPEHAENQINLRKALQVTHDRVQQCEDQLEVLKKRLEEEKSGRISMRPPSLDTIDRTCRNIQLALEERSKVIQQLNSRIEAMSPSTSKRFQTSQIASPVPSTVAPPYANLAAAALNSERSSLKLRNTLLNARKRPLLTTRVVDYKAPEPEHPHVKEIKIEEAVQRPTDLFAPESPTPASSFRNRDAQESPLASHGGGGRSRKERLHASAVQFKNVPSPPQSSKPAFDWGPLPGVTPMITLSSDVRGTRGRRRSSTDDSEQWQWEEAK